MNVTFTLGAEQTNFMQALSARTGKTVEQLLEYWIHAGVAEYAMTAIKTLTSETN